MAKVFDCLFLHPSCYYKKEDKLDWMVMPMGMMALASKLKENGFETKIVHIGLEKVLNPNFTVEGLLKSNDAKVIAIDLHWYSHAYEAMNLAKLCKKNQDTYVVLGGYTASFFDLEILRNFPCVDAIVRGEAELPLLELVEGHIRGHDVSSIPNVTLRYDSRLKRNPIGYVADSKALTQLKFTDLNLLDHGYEYLKIMAPHPISLQNGTPRPLLLQPNRLDGLSSLRRGWLSIGRGCKFNCSYCGGGRKAQRIISGRTEPVFRSIDKITEEVIQLKEYGVRQLYIDFDPCPNDRGYYFALFKKLREEGIDISAQFLTWGLPNREFVVEFAKTFDPFTSAITISVESGSEKVRKINDFHYFYSNNDLLKSLDLIEAQGTMGQIYFSVGNSGETLDDFNATLRLSEEILMKHKNILGPWCYSIPIEPASPRYLTPKRYGVELLRHSFMDFFECEQKKSLGDTKNIEHIYGYRTNDMSEAEMTYLSQLYEDHISRFLSVIDRAGYSVQKRLIHDVSTILSKHPFPEST